MQGFILFAVKYEMLEIKMAGFPSGLPTYSVDQAYYIFKYSVTLNYNC